MEVTINTRTGDKGQIADWVGRFESLWKTGNASVDQFMDLLGEDIRLIAPGLRSTKGKAAGHQAFIKTFEVFPDLTAEIISWAFRNDVLFIEMTFSATVGNALTRWHNTDRFRFTDGVATERVAYFDPSKLQKAFLASPSGWRHAMRRIRSGL